MITASKKSSADGFRSDGGPFQVNIISVVVFVLVAGTGIATTAASGAPAWAIVGVIAGVILGLSPRLAQQWERSVVLRLGRFVGLRGPGLFWIVPLADSVTRTVDQRVITTSFAAEQTLTSDTVPVNVDAVLFWAVYDAEKAALEVQDYPVAVSWASQTALRDIVIPNQLQEAMSREAQAAREKAARIILGEAEMEIAKSFEAASRVYQNNPTTLHLRAMNMLYEGLKEKGALMLVPSSAVESMGMGGLLGAAAIQQARLAALAWLGSPWSCKMTNMARRGAARQYNIADAKARLSDLVRKALSGEEVVIAKDHKPLVKLVPVAGTHRRTPGSAKGQVTMSPDFDAPLDDFSDHR